MKKNTIVYLAVIVLLTAIISIFCFTKNKSQIKDTNEISEIVNNSNLELLLNLENFDEKNYSEEKLLIASMEYASKNGFMNETTEGMYIEYINKSELHDIIYELTNITVEAPIQIDDFYYVYDSENEYYYCVPISYPKYQITNINNIYQKDNIYTITCQAKKISDNEVIKEVSITTTLELIEDGFYTNYKIIKQKLEN